VLALALAGCTGDSQGLLLRDLEQLAELPRKMDKVARKDVAPAPAEQAVAAATEQGTTTCRRASRSRGPAGGA
jgi:hypothetical protein